MTFWAYHREGDYELVERVIDGANIEALVQMFPDHIYFEAELVVE